MVKECEIRVAKPLASNIHMARVSVSREWQEVRPERRDVL